MYLFWNKDFFAEVGLDPDVPPTTWEETIEFATKLTNPRKNQFGMGLAINSAPLYWLSLVWGEGGKILDVATRQSLINDEKIATSLALIQDVATNLKVSPRNATGPEIDNMLWAEHAAMLVNGPWLINGLKESGINFGIVATPGGSKRHQVPMESIGFYIPSKTKEKMAVYKFIEYWNSTEIAKEWTMRNGFLPYLYSVINDPEVQNDPIQCIIALFGDLGKVWDQGYPYASMVIDDVFCPLIEQILTGNASPEEELEQADKTLTRILETYQ